MRIAHIAFSAFLVGALAVPEAAAKKQKPSKAAPTPAACSDFYAHVNTAWLRSNPLPPGDDSRSRWNELFELSTRQRESLFNEPGNGRAQQQLSMLMQSASDEARIQADSQKTLASLFNDIDRIKKVSDLSSVVAKLHARGLPVVFAFNSNNIATLSANGLGLPGADFYTGTNQELVSAQARYRSYIESILSASGMRADKISAQSSLILGLEMELARASAPSPEQRVNLKDVGKQYPNLNIAEFLRTQKASADSLAISQPAFFKAINTSFNSKNIEAWKSYLRFHVTNQLAPYLSEPFYAPHAQFYEVYIGGRSAPSTRKEKMRSLLESSAPDLIDAAYIERYGNADAKKRALTIAQQIIETAKASSATSSWLSDAGKAQAFEMLKTLKVDIGSDIRPIDISTNMSSNALNLMRHDSERKKTPNNWSDSAPIVTYIATENRILISHALLQEHMLSSDSPAVDYGAFGSLFAQQLSVALYGTALVNSNDDDAQRAIITSQYNAYPLASGKKVNGTMTATQNLADLSGLELAYKAFTSSATRDKTAQQDFFKSWAHVWARVDRDSALAAAGSKSIHAPYKLRVNGPISNIANFAVAYDCKTGAMQRAAKDQIKIWP
jgi:putative endopeptidase